MPPRRGRGRKTRRTAEESRAGSDDDVHQGSQQQQSNRQTFRPRGKQFKKKADLSSSGSASSGSGSGSSGMSCGQCGGRHPTSQCRGVQGSCRNCGQPGHFVRVCPLLRGPTGPGPTDEHSVHPHHRDFIITPITDQIGPIDSISKTEYYDLKNHFSEPRKSHSPKFSSSAQHIELSIHTESLIQYLCDPQWFRDTASRGPTTIVAPESQFRTCPTDHDSIGYPCMSASGESSTTMHRLLHASGSHPIPPPDDPK
ncbi:hypothetical protein F511_27082 [Dorcoceras hygrometricum]|uniref:CCHC-type domain-containing protein n=1 Tax=Dorcoceras hygrometricum TaxID=472368 RepID=A0A2Z7BRB3_9LAMI|nr:hypothetical protein F511_27082 [Dorcoceras hygrometricum]